MADQCILYPCYFNTALKRSEGRRVPRQSGAKGPSLSDLERALKRAGIRFRSENHNHPSHWARHEGRVIVEWKEGKEALIKKVARHLGGRK
jgi:signal recognition particle subunit SRP19